LVCASGESRPERTWWWSYSQPHIGRRRSTGWIAATLGSG